MTNLMKVSISEPVRTNHFNLKIELPNEEVLDIGVSPSKKVQFDKLVKYWEETKGEMKRQDLKD